MRLWPYESNQRDLEGAWNETLNDVTDNLGEVFLGLGLGCARCHDHKFDPKPKLNAMAGQRIPPSFKRVVTAMGEFDSPLLGSKRDFQRHGQCGAWVSDWLPHTAEIVDELAIIRSCWADGLNHVGSVCQMNTGSVLAGRPSLGSWVN